METAILTMCIIGCVFSLISVVVATCCLLWQKRYHGEGDKLALQKDSEREERLHRMLKDSVSEQRQDIISLSQMLTSQLDGGLSRHGQEVSKSVDRMTTFLSDSVKNTAAMQDALGKTVDARLEGIRSELSRVLKEVRADNTAQLEKLRLDNTAQLDKLREVVDEKLHKSLEERLTQSFSAITDKLEKVRDGFAEMQNLSRGVTDLKKVLGGIKTRGTWGETSLQALLSDLLSPEQYATNATIKSGKVVEFCILLPGTDGEKLYLPLDSKFPLADYQSLSEAADSGDAEGLSTAKKALETRIKAEAKDINEYILPPKTTDFAIMYLPIEGLYAEIARNAQLVEEIRRRYKIIIAGPSTLAALLNSLQVGFRTLALQRNSLEIQRALTSFRTDFARFITLLKKSEDQASKLTDTLGSISKRTQTIDKRLSRLELESDDEVKALAAADVTDDDASDDN